MLTEVKDKTSYFIPTNGTPVLQTKGNKWPSGENAGFISYSPELMRILMTKLKPNCLKLMLLLCGTSPGFYVTQKWVEEKTGLCRQRYIEARSQLIEKGWLTFSPHGDLTIDYDAIFAER